MNNRTDPILYIVIPCYNEQEVLPITAPMFLQKLADLTAAGKISPESRVLFVNDGSKDGRGKLSVTWLRVTRTMQASARAATAAIRMPCWRA